MHCYRYCAQIPSTVTDLITEFFLGKCDFTYRLNTTTVPVWSICFSRWSLTDGRCQTEQLWSEVLPPSALLCPVLLGAATPEQGDRSCRDPLHRGSSWVALWLEALLSWECALCWAADSDSLCYGSADFGERRGVDRWGNNAFSHTYWSVRAPGFF